MPPLPRKHMPGTFIVHATPHHDGPCPDRSCKHARCIRLRDSAEGHCSLCLRSLGYGVALVEAGSLGVVHWACQLDSEREHR